MTRAVQWSEPMTPEEKIAILDKALSEIITYVNYWDYMAHEKLVPPNIEPQHKCQWLVWQIAHRAQVQAGTQPEYPKLNTSGVYRDTPGPA